VAARAGIDEQEPSWLLLRVALATPSRIAVVPVQDLLGLGNDSRMNVPGEEQGNWGFRLEPDQLDDALARRLRGATGAAGRR
jgi:4-alpha-glucanotransferase